MSSSSKMGRKVQQVNDDDLLDDDNDKDFISLLVGN
jgi:hypothetical protein